MYVVQTLESLLPARRKVESVSGEHVEEVNLMEYEQQEESAGGGRREAYDDGDDDEDGGPGGAQRVQCAQQWSPPS